MLILRIRIAVLRRPFLSDNTLPSSTQNAAVAAMEYGSLGTLFNYFQIMYRNRSVFIKQELEYVAAFFAKQVGS
jgi:hypothetical protein